MNLGRVQVGVIGFICMYLGFMGSMNPSIEYHVFQPFPVMTQIALYFMIVLGAYFVWNAFREDKNED